MEQKPTVTCLGFNIRRLPARFFSTFQSGHEGSWKGVVQPEARGWKCVVDGKRGWEATFAVCTIMY